MSVTSTSIEEGVLDDQIAFLNDDTNSKSIEAAEIATTIEKLKSIKHEYECLLGSAHTEHELVDDVGDDDGNVSIWHYDDFLNQLECQVKVSFTGVGIPIKDKKIPATVPHDFQLRGKAQSIDKFGQSDHVVAPTMSFAHVTKRKSGQNGRTKRAMRKISASSFSNHLTPFKGSLEDMEIANLFDYWSWIEYQEIFNSSLRADSINELQFRPLFADTKLHQIELPGAKKKHIYLPPYHVNLKDSEYHNGGKGSPSKGSGAPEGKADAEKNESEIGHEDSGHNLYREIDGMSSNDQANANSLPFYYQRLLNSLILTDERDVKSGVFKDLETTENYEVRGCTDQSEFLFSELLKESNTHTSSFIMENETNVSQEINAGVFDMSWMSLSHKTNGILGICGIIENVMVKYDEHGEDIFQKKARKEGPYDQINASLRGMLRQVREVDHEVNQKIASLWHNISNTKGVMGIKNESELRKHREHEKSMYIKWEKYLKKKGMESFLTRSGAASLSLMAAPAQEQGAYAELPW